MNIKTTTRLFILSLCAAASFAHNNAAQIASGGNYTLTQAAIANGGASGNGASGGGNYSLEGTIGQAAAGRISKTRLINFSRDFGRRKPSRRLPPKLPPAVAF